MDGLMPFSQQDEQTFYSNFFSPAPVSPDSSLSSENSYLTASFDDLGIPRAFLNNPTYTPAPNGNGNDALFGNQFLDSGFGYNMPYSNAGSSFGIDSSFGMNSNDFTFGSQAQQLSPQIPAQQQSLQAQMNQVPSTSYQSVSPHLSPIMDLPAAFSSTAYPPTATTAPDLSKTITKHSSDKSRSLAPVIEQVGTAPTARKVSQASQKKRKLAEDVPEEVAEDVPEGPTGHNAVEKRYRTKINSSLTELQHLIPALDHLKESDGASGPPRRSSAFILSASAQNIHPIGSKRDGVVVPNKLSKGIIIDKGIEYLRHLKKERSTIQQKLEVAERILQRLPHAQAAYEQELALAAAQRAASADSPGSDGSCSSRRSAYGLFAGLGLAGTGYAASSSDSASAVKQGTSQAWARSVNLVKKASIPKQQFASNTPSLLHVLVYTGIFALACVIFYNLFHYLSNRFASQSAPGNSPIIDGKRQMAFMTLHESEQAVAQSPDRETQVTHARRLRNALLVLSDAPRFGLLGTLIGLVVEGLSSYLIGAGLRPMVFKTLKGKDLRERVVSLVRLIEVESAFGNHISYRAGRLYTIMRLHNLVRSRYWSDDLFEIKPVVMSRPHVDATMALAFVSVFAAQASPLSRRRRFWKTAAAAPKKSTDGMIEGWAQAALASDYDTACSVAFRPSYRVCSASDSLPLLRVAEDKVHASLTAIWIDLFKATVQALAPRSPVSAAEREAPLTFAVEPTQVLHQIKSIVDSTVPISPSHTLALITRGFLCIGTHDYTGARSVCMILETLLSKSGPAIHIASAHAFVRLLNPTAHDSARLEQEPLNGVDLIATVCLRWLIANRDSKRSDMPEEAMLQLSNMVSITRLLLNDQVWQQQQDKENEHTLSDAKEACLRSFRSMGKLMDDTDSGFGEE